MSALKGKSIIITGASRGIGRAIALRVAKEGANITILAKTVKPQEKLPGTIYSVAEEVEALGGKALPIQVDLRNAEMIQDAVTKTADHFGGIDIVVNNAGALSLTATLETPMKRFDLLCAVNARATFCLSQAALPYLFRSDNPHILNISPPLNLDNKWFKDHLAYTISKYGMSMCTLGMSAEFSKKKIAVNSLWPQTAIATSAIIVNFPKEVYERSRKPDIMADATLHIISQPSDVCTGNFFTDEGVLKSSGVRDFSRYAINADTQLFTDAFLD